MRRGRGGWRRRGDPGKAVVSCPTIWAPRNLQICCAVLTRCASMLRKAIVRLNLRKGRVARAFVRVCATHRLLHN